MTPVAASEVTAGLEVWFSTFRMAFLESQVRTFSSRSSNDFCEPLIPDFESLLSQNIQSNFCFYTPPVSRPLGCKLKLRLERVSS